VSSSQSAGKVICTIVWNCPGGEQENSFGIRGNARGWLVGFEGPVLHGAIGETLVSMWKDDLLASDAFSH
jgi:hypothetical protein